MTYKSNEDLPDDVKALPAEAQTLFREAYNAHKADNPDAPEAECMAAGWAAVKKKFKKSGDSWAARAVGDSGTIELSVADHFSSDQLVLDYGKITPTVDGYITAVAKVARTGIQLYTGDEMGKPEMKQVRVYRPPHEVFARAAMHSAAHKPITLQHPKDAAGVNSKNYREVKVGGNMGGEVARDGDFLVVPLVLMDDALVKPVVDRKIYELSLGYKTNIRFEQGVSDKGEPYDAVMEDIRINHLAIVDKARGGSDLRVGDEGDAAMPVKRIIDNVEVSFDTEQSSQIAGRAVETRDASIKELTARLESSTADAAKAKTAAETSAADQKKLLDEALGKVTGLEVKLKEAEVTDEKMQEFVNTRVEILTKGKALLADKFDPKMKNGDIMRAVVGSKLNDAVKLKAMSDDHVKASFDVLTAGIEIKADDSTGNLAAIIDAAGKNGGGGGEAAKALNKFNSDISDAWKNPPAMTS